jgi:hypothetical protein
VRKRIPAVGLLLLVALASGCVITETPLSDPAPSDADKLLYGRWQSDDEYGSTTLEFAPPTDATPKFRGTGDQKIMVVTFARYAKNGNELLGGTGTERAFVSEVGVTTFLNIYDERERGYRINRYQIDGPTLDFWRMDTSAVADAIRKGDLPAGEMSYDRGTVQKVRITRPLRQDDPNEIRDKLRALVTGKDAASIFPEHGRVRYTRIKDKK